MRPKTGTALAVVLFALPALAASHREAPAMTLDPGADISDLYAFVSYDDANLSRAPGDRKVTLIMNVVPSQEPSSGPNYFAFDDEVLYEFRIDHDRDGLDDVRYEIRFKTETVSPEPFIATLGPVTSLEGTGSEGLSRKQRYTVTEASDCGIGRVGCATRTTLFRGQLLSAVPSNVGPRTTPAYEDLAAQGVYADPSTGARVFAGQRAETFAIDLGAVFDTLNLRTETGAGRPLPVQSASEDASDDTNPFGINAFSGFNVNTIALELPIRRLTRDGQPAGAGNGTIGVYAATSRRKSGTVASPGRLFTTTPFTQVSRMGNPLVNELIIPIGLKDRWNQTPAHEESQFLRYYRELTVAQALQLVFGVPVPAGPREDVVRLLTKYAGQDANPALGPFADLLRLDMTVPPTPPASMKRLGPLAHDASGNPTPDGAGFPNGRRPNDDVTDLVVRVAGGEAYIVNYVGDGVGLNERGITPEFPFLPTPFEGRNRRHQDPGE